MVEKELVFQGGPCGGVDQNSQQNPRRFFFRPRISHPAPRVPPSVLWPSSASACSASPASPPISCTSHSKGPNPLSTGNRAIQRRPPPRRRPIQPPRCPPPLPGGRFRCRFLPGGSFGGPQILGVSAILADGSPRILGVSGGPPTLIPAGGPTLLPWQDFLNIEHCTSTSRWYKSTIGGTNQLPTGESVGF